MNAFFQKEALSQGLYNLNNENNQALSDEQIKEAIGGIVYEYLPRRSEANKLIHVPVAGNNIYGTEEVILDEDNIINKLKYWIKYTNKEAFIGIAKLYSSDKESHISHAILIRAIGINNGGRESVEITLEDPMSKGHVEYLDSGNKLLDKVKYLSNELQEIEINTKVKFLDLQKDNESNCAHICLARMKHYVSLDFFSTPKLTYSNSYVGNNDINYNHLQKKLYGYKNAIRKYKINKIVTESRNKLLAKDVFYEKWLGKKEVLKDNEIRGISKSEGMKKEEIENNLKMLTSSYNINSYYSNIEIENTVIDLHNVRSSINNWINNDNKQYYSGIIALENNKNNKHAILLNMEKIGEEVFKIEIIDPHKAKEALFKDEIKELQNELSIYPGIVYENYIGIQDNKEATCGDNCLIMLQEQLEDKLKNLNIANSLYTGNASSDYINSNPDYKDINNGVSISNQNNSKSYYITVKDNINYILDIKLQAQLEYFTNTGIVFETLQTSINNNEITIIEEFNIDNIRNNSDVLNSDNYYSLLLHNNHNEKSIDKELNINNLGIGNDYIRCHHGNSDYININYSYDINNSQKLFNTESVFNLGLGFDNLKGFNY